MPLDLEGFGTDLSCVDDLDETMSEVGGRDTLRQWAIRAITTTRGAVLDAPDDCIDVRDFIGDDLSARDASAMRVAIVDELEKDERVKGVRIAEVRYDAPSETLYLGITLDPVEGPPFALTLAITETSVTVLSQG